MATTTYLSNPSVTVNSVDLSDQCTSAAVTVGYDQLETTAFGSSGHSFAAGLETVDVTLTLFVSYGTGEVEDTLQSLVGTTTTIVVKPSDAAVGASNPSYTVTGAYLANLPVINASVAELSSIDVTFTGGTWARATS
jgi:hypothetical protein